MSKPGPISGTRFKTTIKMAISKLQFIQEKKTALAKQQRRQLADLLNQGKELSAKIRVENIIREDVNVELLEYLELYCELLLARLGMITDASRTTCDTNIIDAVQSIIYAAQYTELKELVQLKELFIHKYGIEFGKEALDNSSNHIPEKIIKRCEIEVPSENLVNLYLCEIASAYVAPYSGLVEREAEEKAERELNGEGKENGDEQEIQGDEKKESASSLPEPTPEPAPAASTKPQNDFDALKARFAALKRN